MKDIQRLAWLLWVHTLDALIRRLEAIQARYERDE